MNLDLKIGDTVKFSQENSTWSESEYNPINVHGEVCDVDKWIYVNWDNGETNAYRASDNDLIKIS